jgi:hypothetical protein
MADSHDRVAHSQAAPGVPATFVKEALRIALMLDRLLSRRCQSGPDAFRIRLARGYTLGVIDELSGILRANAAEPLPIESMGDDATSSASNRQRKSSPRLRRG